MLSTGFQHDKCAEDGKTDYKRFFFMNTHQNNNIIAAVINLSTRNRNMSANKTQTMSAWISGKEFNKPD